MFLGVPHRTEPVLLRFDLHLQVQQDHGVEVPAYELQSFAESAELAELNREVLGVQVKGPCLDPPTEGALAKKDDGLLDDIQNVVLTGGITKIL